MLTFLIAHDQQVRLSEDLQLLHFVRRGYLSGSHCGGQYTKYIDPELKLLDSIALYLANDIPGDTVAVALDTSTSRVQFILAKNNTLTDQDIRTAAIFFPTIIEQEAVDLLEFALFNSPRTVKSRIQKCAEIDMDVVDKLLRAYKFMDISDEFKDTSSILSQLTEMWSMSDPHSMLRQAFTELTSADSLKPEVIITNEHFTRLSMFAYFIVNSRFFCDHDGFQDILNHAQVRKYRRRLYKLSRYFDGANRIHATARRFTAQDAGISYVWIENHASWDLVKMSTSPGAVASVYFPTITEAEVTRVQPNIMEQWTPTLRTFIHAELRLLLHLEHYSPSVRGNAKRRFIGCNRESCLCCGEWVREWNKTEGTRWIISGGSALSFKTWALVGVPEYVDQTVINRVQHCLMSAIEKLTDYRRVLSDSDQLLIDSILKLNRR